MSVMSCSWALGRAYPTLLTLLIRAARRRDDINSAHKPEMVKRAESVPRKDTGGERRIIPRGDYCGFLTELGGFYHEFLVGFEQNVTVIPEQLFPV